MTTKTLLELHVQRLDEHETGICKNQAGLYRIAVKDFSCFLGRPATIEDLQPESINAWLENLKTRRAMVTVKGMRGRIRTLWLYAHENDLCGPPKRMRKIILPIKNPVALTQAEVSKLLETVLSYDVFPTYPRKVYDLVFDMRKAGKSLVTIADALSSKGIRTVGNKPFSEVVLQRILNEFMGRTAPSKKSLGANIPMQIYIASIIAVAWDTGLRLGDLLSFRKDSLIRQPEGGATFEIVMNKTKHLVSGYLKPETMVLVDRCLASGDAERELIWPCDSKETFWRKLRIPFADAGLEKNKFKHIRAGAASAAELVRFGGGTELLGHRNRQTTVQHYIDPKVVRKESIILPSVLPTRKPAE